MTNLSKSMLLIVFGFSFLSSGSIVLGSDEKDYIAQTELANLRTNIYDDDPEEEIVNRLNKNTLTKNINIYQNAKNNINPLNIHDLQGTLIEKVVAAIISANLYNKTINSISDERIKTAISNFSFYNNNTYYTYSDVINKLYQIYQNGENYTITVSQYNDFIKITEGHQDTFLIVPY